MNRYRIDFADMEWELPIPGVRHKVVVKDGVKLRLVEFSQEMAPHWCSAGHTGQILSGTFEIEFDDGIRLFEAGDGVIIPSGDEHRHRARSVSEVVQAIFVEEAS
ncbi:MAG: cupin domain-containing protein [Planctomycetota bacterium]